MPAAAIADPPASTESTARYLFSYFTGEGDGGLHLAWSADGLKWHALMDGAQERIFLRPDTGHVMRDPCLLLGPDGLFRLVWTDGWDVRAIGYASSTDLVHWSPIRLLPVMENEPTARNSWAPEVHFDPSTKRYLILWSSTVPGRFPDTDNTCEDGLNHRIYATTTADFKNFTPTTLFFDPKFSVIDATLLPFGGKSWMIFKNETLRPTPAKDLLLAHADTMLGPYTGISAPLPTQPAHWVEGPTALQIGDRVLLYFDCYSAHHFGVLATTDMHHWTDLTPQLSMPVGIRHGTALAVPPAIVDRLLEAAPISR